MAQNENNGYWKHMAQLVKASTSCKMPRQVPARISRSREIFQDALTYILAGEEYMGIRMMAAFHELFLCIDEDFWDCQDWVRYFGALFVLKGEMNNEALKGALNVIDRELESFFKGCFVTEIFHQVEKLPMFRFAWEVGSTYRADPVALSLKGYHHETVGDLIVEAALLQFIRESYDNARMLAGVGETLLGTAIAACQLDPQRENARLDNLLFAKKKAKLLYQISRHQSGAGQGLTADNAKHVRDQLGAFISGNYQAPAKPGIVEELEWIFVKMKLMDEIFNSPFPHRDMTPGRKLRHCLG